jgi:hypothetical protein
MIGDGHTQGMKVISNVLHLTTVVVDAEVALLEDVELDIKLKNTGLAVSEELDLDHELRLTSGLHRFLNDLMEFEGEGAGSMSP